MCSEKIRTSNQVSTSVFRRTSFSKLARISYNTGELRYNGRFGRTKTDTIRSFDGRIPCVKIQLIGCDVIGVSKPFVVRKDSLYPDSLDDAQYLEYQNRVLYRKVRYIEIHLTGCDGIRSTKIFCHTESFVTSRFVV